MPRKSPDSAAFTSATQFLQESLNLTPRQAEVLHWVAEGKTNPEIGIILECSFFTVKNHMKGIFQRLGVSTRTAATACAYRAHIAGPLAPSETTALAKKASTSRSKPA